MRLLRRPIVIASVACVLAACASAFSISCLIADPPATLPATVESAPTIARDNVIPPADQILTVWPSEFSIPIIRSDSTSTYQWRMYIDYDPSTGQGRVDGTNANVSISLPVVDFTVNPPTGGGCHVVEFLVAASFGDVDQSSHTPSGSGSDSVTWFYSPGGDLAGCPIYVDAGFDGAFPDASDGGDAGPNDATGDGGRE